MIGYVIRSRAFFTLMVGVLLCLPMASMTDAAYLSPIKLHIEASNSNGSGVFEYVDNEPTFVDGNYEWDLEGPIEIVDETARERPMIARLDSASLRISADPVLALGFFVTGGGSSTTLTINSPLLSFAEINPALARASASLTVTDGSGDGAFFTGGYAGGTKSYQANYNGFVPAGTLFANLVDNASTSTAFGSVTGQEDSPSGGGFSGGLGGISSMSAQYKFTAGAGDQVSGTSVFVVIPEPATLSLLLLGSLALVRRRR